MHYDVCIIGLGAMGSATAWSLSTSGASVIAVDQFAIGHDKGSSHGETRIIRSVYFEGRVYTPLVRAAYAAWERIHKQYGQQFLRITGGLDISLRQDSVFEAALTAAQSGGFSHDVLDHTDLARRFPLLDLPTQARAVWSPDSGLLDSDDATAWMRDEAVNNGADLRGETRVSGWGKTAAGYQIKTKTETITARKLIIAAGAWAAELIPQLAPILTPERQVLCWYGKDDMSAYSDMPIFQYETEDSERYYAFPPHKGAGLKFGLYHHRRQRGAEYIKSSGVELADKAALAAGLDQCLPGLSAHPQRYAECRFTLAPDDRFLIGLMPGDEDMVVLSPCSGHGFKFAPAIGDIAAELALEQEVSVDISGFALERVL
jgi:sarcosine oxidase